jgi:phenylalanyl-tRNA synthetase beta chain
MRVPLRWLRELTDVDAPPEKLAGLLDLSGTKVEAVHRPHGEVSGVVVAEVLGIRPHPNADNLTLVEVTPGRGEVQEVVCGARNFAVGDRVPLATVGAKLPDLAVTERKIRGIVSRGMLCSAAELGVSRDHSGILVLPDDAELGRDAVETLGLDDVVLELEITPNRPDCMGMIGVGREVAALLGGALRMPDASLPPHLAGSSPVVLEVMDPSGCTRYVARYIEGLGVARSPSWMAARLLACGVRPISNVVDVTNYVMLETGHPLHAFDAAKVEDAHVIVRRAVEGERLTTLDGVDRALDVHDLLIADPAGPLGLAGVMGGESSEVSGSTSAIILEAARFDTTTIAAMSRRHNLRTEASTRFERGTDPLMPPFAAARAAALLCAVTPARVSGDVQDFYPEPYSPQRLVLRPARTDQLLGMHIPAQEQLRRLESVQIPAVVEDGAIVVETPSFRPDLKREVDLIEEVARLHGFDKVPVTLPPGAAGGLSPRQSAQRSLARTLTAAGVTEAWTSSFLSERDLDRLGLEEDHPLRRVLPLANPMSEEESCLRTTVLPGLLRAVRHNVSHRQPGVALFELAPVYQWSGESLPHEPLVLAAAFCGTRRPQDWRAPAERWDFFAVKGVLDSTLARLALPALVYEPVEAASFHPTRAAGLSLDRARIGVIGELHPEVCVTLEVPPATVAFEVLAEPLLDRLPGRLQIEDLPRLPANYIDLAVVVDEDVPAGVVEDVIRSAGAPELVSLRLFDLYRGGQIPPGKKSLAYALELRLEDRTLTDEDAAAVRDRIVTELAERTGGALRDK